MILFSKKTLTWPQNFAAAFSGFQRKNKILEYDPETGEPIYE